MNPEHLARADGIVAGRGGGAGVAGKDKGAHLGAVVAHVVALEVLGKVECEGGVEVEGDLAAQLKARVAAPVGQKISIRGELIQGETCMKEDKIHNKNSHEKSH